MPEGDTVWRTATRLRAALAGEPIVRCDLRWPSLATLDLRGATTLDVVSAGKHILQRLDTGVTVHSHLRMEGQWRIAGPGPETDRLATRPDLRALLGTSTWTALGLRLGRLDVLPTSHEHRLVGHLGPDVLGPGWDPHEAVRRIRASAAPLGATLIDQRILAGIGTMYAAEALFVRRLPPWTPADRLSPDDADALVALLHRFLDENRHHAVQSTTGDRRRGETAWVHARVGLPCRRCGTPVRVSGIGDPSQPRVLFYCAGCQGGLAPGDDGRRQRPLGQQGRTDRVRRPTPRRRRGARPGG